MASKRSDGRREGKYVFEGKRYSIYGNTKAVRDAKWAVKKQELEKHRYKADRELTVSQYFERWLENRKNIKPSTMRTYTKLRRMVCNVQLYKDQTFGDIKIIKAEPQNCRDLQDKLKDKYQTRTVNDAMSLLKKCMQTAVNEDVLEKNPCRTIERLQREEPEARDTKHRCLTRAEVDAFMKHAEDSPFYNLYQLLLFSGLRVGEASALTIADVKGDTITVNKTVTRSETGYEIGYWTKTESGKRIVPMYPNAKQAIVREKEKNAMIDGKNIVSIKPIFRLPKGGLIRPDRVNSDIAKRCKDANIEKFTCHSFRATFISRCVDSGMPVKDLMEIVGHKDVEMTLALYAHNDMEHTKERLFAVNF